MHLWSLTQARPSHQVLEGGGKGLTGVTLHPTHSATLFTSGEDGSVLQVRGGARCKVSRSTLYPSFIKKPLWGGARVYKIWL